VGGDIDIWRDFRIAMWRDELRRADLLDGYATAAVSAEAAVFKVLHTHHAGTGAVNPNRDAHRGATAISWLADGLTIPEIAARLAEPRSTVEADIALYGRLRGAAGLRRVESRRARACTRRR
jgi:hypothetical protein